LSDYISVTPGAGKSIATDLISGVDHQLMKVEYGADGAATQVSDTSPLPAREPKVASATVAAVGDATGSTQLLAANAGRLGVVVVNDSSAVLYLKYGTAATSASYSYRLAQYDIWEMPRPVYTGIIHGAWASDAGGSAMVTEL